MARSEISTLMPLDTWAAQMGINPWEFNQVGNGFPITNQGQCPDVWMQYSWQNQNFISREELARAIADAEAMVADQFTYWPAPKYIVNEEHPYPNNRVSGHMALTPYGLWKAISLNWTKVQGGGTQTRTLISAGAAVALSDFDGDGVKEKFTVTVPTTVTDPEEIAIYFTAADRDNADVAETWRIRPVDVVLSAPNAVITGHSSLLVVPKLTLKYNPSILDVTDPNTLVTQVDVYRIYRDDTTSVANPAQGVVMWEQAGCETPPCAVDMLPICLGSRDAEQGMVSVDFSLGGTQTPPRNCEPDRVKINYLSGYPLVRGRMDDQMAAIVSKLATSLLAEGACACDRSSSIIQYWRTIPTNKDTNMVTLKDMDECPFGVTRGALWAWRRIRDRKNVEAISI